MSFTALPPELKLDIAGYLDPTSCFNIAISRKDLWNTFRSMVDTHARLTSEYKTFQVGTSGSKIFEIIESPSLGGYVRDCILDTSEYRDVDGETAGFKAEKHRLEDYYSKWMADERLQGRPIEYEGRDIITLPTVLMHHLPFLTTLSLRSDFLVDGGGQPFLDFVHVLAKAYIRSSRGHSMRDMPFSHLTTVAVSDYWEHGTAETDWCSHFLYIPTLRNFVGQWMSGAYDGLNLRSGPFAPEWHEDAELEKYHREFAHHPLYQGAPHSNVEELLFLGAGLEMFVLYDILSRTPSLKRFSYESMDEIDLESVYYCPRTILRYLVQHVSQSLEHLTLEDYPYRRYPPGPNDRRTCGEGGDKSTFSIRDFKKLKTLKCGWEAIYPEYVVSTQQSPSRPIYHTPRYRADFDVRELLPESLETLHIDANSSTEEEWSQLCAYFEHDSPLTPNLRGVYLERDSHRAPYYGIGPKPQHALDRPWENPLAKLVDRLPRLYWRR